MLPNIDSVAAFALAPPDRAAHGRPRSSCHITAPLPPAPAVDVTIEEHREALITRHLPLVERIARGLARRAPRSAVLDLDDMISSGVEGLIRAVDSFDATYAVPFGAWARLHIRTTIQDALRAVDPLPHALRARGREIQQARADLAQRQGTTPSDVQIASALDLPLHKLRGMLRLLTRTSVSLERGTAGPADGHPTPLADLLADDDPLGRPEQVLERDELRRLVRAAVERLPERDRTVVQLYYREEQDMPAIARRLGVSQARISQLHARAIRALHAALAGPEHAAA